MKIDDQLVDKLSTLARLEFTQEESMQLKDDLEKMIAFISKLEEVDTAGTAPLIFLSEETNVFREDQVKETISREEAMKNVPVSKEGYILVPKVLSKAE